MIQKLLSNVNLLQKGLDASWLRNEVISNNIANSDTPGFKTSKVEFEKIFSEALERDSNFVGNKTREKHIDIGYSDLAKVKPTVVKSQTGSLRLDGNNINIEEEMTELAKNTIYYNILSEKISKDLALLKKVINEGK